MDINSIVNRFLIGSKVKEIKLFGNGHINTTYRITVEESTNPGYILQKINTDVFREPAELMSNIEKVTSHIRGKEKSKSRETLEIIRTEGGNLFYENESACWRMFRFIEGGESYEVAKTPEQAFKAAEAYGEFMVALEDLHPSELNITIPNFHNLDYRLQEFDSALERANPKRLQTARKEIQKAEELREHVSAVYHRMIHSGAPIRIIHNDTKFNNALFSQKGNAKAIIDLDTVMPGYVLYDVGDGLRTGVVTSREDETDLSRVSIDMEMYEAYLSGYINGAQQVLTKTEREAMPKAGMFMAFIMGVRFVTDYLNGDIYFRIHTINHNLIRARCQLYVTELFREKVNEVKVFKRIHLQHKNVRNN